MLKLRYSSQFKKDYKLAKRRCLPVSELKDIIIRLCNEEALETKYHDHALEGEWKDFRECHIRPDWLLIYRIAQDELLLVAQRTGSHSDLFGK